MHPIKKGPAQYSWNPVTGCTKCGPGCMNCYVEPIANRLKAGGNPSYITGFKPQFHPGKLKEPLELKTSKIIQVCSMGDLFHEKIPDEFILQVFKVMNDAWWHKFLILTRRSERLLKLSRFIRWSENIWMGVSIENEAYTYRISDLRKTGAVVKVLCFEPLIGRIRSFAFFDIDWIIAGGENGKGARHTWEEWILTLKNQAEAVGIPFYFKGWGWANKNRSSNMIDGKSYQEYPIPSSLRKSKGRKLQLPAQQCVLFG